MRFFGQKSRLATLVFKLGITIFPLAIATSQAVGQAPTPPYVIPYTASTYAGPHAQYTAGQACGDGVGIALDIPGDGCNTSVVSIGIDPHDIVVDPQGNVYWQDGTGSAGYVHKISPVSHIMTMYAGSYTNSKPCASGNGDKYGDGCIATDGLANATAALFTAKFNASRGLGVAVNGDVLVAGYNNSYDHKISAATGLMTAALGTGTSGYVDALISKATVNGSRGITEDANGNVYVADTGNNAIRVAYNGFGTIPPAYQYISGGAGSTAPVTPVAGQSYSITGINTVGTKTVTSGVPALQAIVSAPEDIEVDSNGNIWIADAGNAVIRVIYMGKGTLPNVAAPIFGYIYTVAGCVSTACTNVYPKDGTTPTFNATTTALNVRKIALDSRNNLYIADTSNNVVWFVDNATGNIRLLLGVYGGTAGAAAPGCAAQTDTVGDGCPGPRSTIYTSVASNAGFGLTPDNQGNLYYSDNEGSNLPAASRLRKLLSGLNFPTVTVGAAAVTQTIQLHFAPLDTPSAVTPFAISGTDYVLGTPACTLNTDTTTDCLIPVTFTPTIPGRDTAVLVATSTLGATASFEITGAGKTASVAFDPGNVALATSSVSAPQGIAIDASGNTYIADTANNRILLQTGVGGPISVFAGTGSAAYTGDNGLATAATLKAPRGVAIDTTGAVFIADTGNNVIRRVDGATHIITTYAGGATTVCGLASNARGDACPGTQATFNAPSGIAADNLGQIYVADTGNNVIRQISVSSFVSTLAGGATASTTCTGKTDTQGDGCSAASTVFAAPTALAYDATGNNLFVADTGNNIVRKIYLANTFNVTSATAYSVLFNPVTLVAGNGQGGRSIDVGNVATLSQLSAPTGVAVDAAGNVYIADTGNSAVRLVNANGGLISTIVGLLGTSGTSTPPGSAVATQLAAPGAVGVTPLGTLIVADTGNNRILSDVRAQVSYDFRRVNVGNPSPIQNFTEVNIGVSPAPLSNPVFTASGNTQFSLAPAANSNGTIKACATSLAAGAICNIAAQFSPTTTGSVTATYTENGTGSAGGSPKITLIGLGAVLTPTSSAVAQTVPATGNSQFGGSVTLTGTVTPNACNTAAPSCFPTGTISFVIDGTAAAPVTLGASGTASQAQSGLSVGNHTISCNYSGDDFYAASSCGAITITVAAASTTSSVTALPNNQVQFPTTSCATLTTPPSLAGDIQCVATTLTATVKSNTTGTPTGTVTFFASGGTIGSTPVAIGMTSLDPNSGAGTVSLTYTFDKNRLLAVDPATGLVLNSTLPPGTYSITCSYSGASNYATSTCAATSLTILPQPTDFTLVARGCAVTALAIPGSLLTGEGVACNPGPENFQGTTGVPLVTVAQGSTTDATIFINANNTISGTFKFSCSGLPANSTCTFAPTTVTFSPSTGLTTPQAVDMTLWTDLQPGFATSSLRQPTGTVNWAFLLGWPATLLGLAGVFRFRRRIAHRGLTLLAVLMIMCGSSLVFTGCGAGGPGAYQPVFTPAGTYPITVTVTGPNGSHTVVVYWTVTSPGITGQQ